MDKNSEQTLLKQYLTFRIGEESYAIGILRVREIIDSQAITRVPAMPTAVRGVLNLRGSVLPVIDLAVKFGAGERKVTKQSCVIIVELALEGQPTVMGILADAVEEVIDLADDQIEPTPEFGTHSADYLLGLGKLPNGFVLILDIDRLLSIDELTGDACQVASPKPSDPVETAVVETPQA